MSDLLDAHDVLFVDLDGTLYRGQVAVPGAVDAVAGATQRGTRTVYVTNNASRRPVDVAGHLAQLGFPATEQDVMTSSQAAAAMLAEQLPTGAPVLVVGTDALAEEVIRVGLTVTEDPDTAAAVVQGHSPDTGWRKLADATVALRAGAAWVACNIDPTLPTERGPLPGNGSMVAAVRMASGREPQVAGKPAPRLLREALRRSEARSGLVVGDRLDTDIEGGNAVDLPTLLVLTGVSDPAEVLAAPPALRPTYLAADMSALTRPAEDLLPAARPGWKVRPRADGTLVLSGNEADSSEPVLDALRALAAAHWAGAGGAVRVLPDGPAAERAVTQLGLPTGADADTGRSTTVANA